MRLLLDSGTMSVGLRGRLACAGEETSLDLTHLTLTSDRAPQVLFEFSATEQQGVGGRIGVLAPQKPPRLTLELERGDLCQT
jgi:hypothetical protein